MMTNFPTKQETQYKIAILNLLIAIDEDIVDWRRQRVKLPAYF